MRGDQINFDIHRRAPGTNWAFEAQLGKGGMGVVYAVVNQFGVEGAMKVMLPALARTPDVVARFFQEARMLAELKHPNIVGIIDFDRLTDGTPFVVMERLKGRTLGSALRALREKGGPTPSSAYEIMRQLCEGLHCAHSSTPPIVHRDIKPENVFVHVASADTVLIKLIDFGIASVISNERAPALGTLRYMAPELLVGQPASPQSDIYSAALLLYQILTDRFPWDVDVQTAMAMANAHLKLEPTPPSRYESWIPSAVDECIMQALAKDPKARPSSAHEFCAGLCVLQFVSDSRLRAAIDIDSTTPTRMHDQVDLASLAGLAVDAVPTERDADHAPSVDLNLTPVLPPRSRPPTRVTPSLAISAVLVASVGAVLVASVGAVVALRSTNVAHRATAASVAAPQSVYQTDSPLVDPPPQLEAPAPATSAPAVRVPPTHAAPRGKPQSEPKTDPKTDGGFEPVVAPTEPNELPFLPDQP